MTTAPAVFLLHKCQNPRNSLFKESSLYALEQTFCLFSLSVPCNGKNNTVFHHVLNTVAAGHYSSSQTSATTGKPCRGSAPTLHLSQKVNGFKAQSTIWRVPTHGSAGKPTHLCLWRWQPQLPLQSGLAFCGLPIGWSMKAKPPSLSRGI